MAQTPVQIRSDKLAEKVIKALNNRHFEAYYCPTKEAALVKALSLIPRNDIVSWGGSDSIKEIGLMKYILENNYSVINRDLAKTPEEKTEIMRQALTCDTFLMSANAVSEDGQLVNVDGNGNRVAAMIFGPKSVIVIAGINKIVKSEADAVVRARTIASPINAQRFDIKTPCHVTGTCENCTTPDCICTYVVTTRISRPARRIKVILVGEPIGY
ncbi:MAG: lactate utilization protein [Flexilinea sp.]